MKKMCVRVRKFIIIIRKHFVKNIISHIILKFTCRGTPFKLFKSWGVNLKSTYEDLFVRDGTAWGTHENDSQD